MLHIYGKMYTRRSVVIYEKNERIRAELHSLLDNQFTKINNQWISYIIQQFNQHRDLKPANLLIGNDGNIKVIQLILEISDSGLGKITTLNIQKQHSLVGTPLYAAPQILSGGTYSAKYDIYSLGVIIYEMIFRRLPIEAVSQDALMKNQEKLITNPINIPPIQLIGEEQDRIMLEQFLKKSIVYYEESRLDWETLFFQYLNIPPPRDNLTPINIPQSVQSSLGQSKIRESSAVQQYNSSNSKIQQHEPQEPERSTFDPQGKRKIIITEIIQPEIDTKDKEESIQYLSQFRQKQEKTIQRQRKESRTNLNSQQFQIVDSQPQAEQIYIKQKKNFGILPIKLEIQLPYYRVYQLGEIILAKYQLVQEFLNQFDIVQEKNQILINNDYQTMKFLLLGYQYSILLNINHLLYYQSQGSLLKELFESKSIYLDIQSYVQSKDPMKIEQEIKFTKLIFEHFQILQSAKGSLLQNKWILENFLKQENIYYNYLMFLQEFEKVFTKVKLRQYKRLFAYGLKICQLEKDYSMENFSQIEPNSIVFVNCEEKVLEQYIKFNI